MSIACLPLTAREPLGCLAITFGGRHAFEADECAWLGVLAQQCAMALERARLLAAERRQAARAEYLRRFTAALASSLDVEETLGTAAGLVVPALGDFCFFDVRMPDGEVRRVARAHESPERQRLLDGTRWEASETPETSGCALQTGAPVFLPRIDEAWMRGVARSPEHLALLRALGPCSGMSVPLRTKERVLGALTLFHAQSGRHYTEEDLELAVELGRSAAVALENAQLFHQAREAIRLRDDFLAIASHELNTPITALKLHLTRLGKTTQEADTRARVEAAGRQVNRLGKLVHELLDVSRISQGRLRLECEELDLVALCREVLGRQGDELVRACTAVHLLEAGPVVGRWDRSRVEQVVTNLVSNAVKYGMGQPVELEVRAAEGLARLTVKDRGIGIAPEQQARLFQRFERGVSLRHYGGFGLGLWITRQVVEAHGGRIRLQSAVDEGTCVTVELPLFMP
jgi:signal transduction histidine kinase